MHSRLQLSFGHRHQQNQLENRISLSCGMTSNLRVQRLNFFMKMFKIEMKPLIETQRYSLKGPKREWAKWETRRERIRNMRQEEDGMKDREKMEVKVAEGLHLGMTKSRDVLIEKIENLATIHSTSVGFHDS